MKTIALISTMIALPAASLLAQGQSDIEALRSRVDSHERRISLLERELSRLRGSSVAETTPRTKQAVPTSGEYTVVKGDMLTRIAYRHKTTVKAIKSANGLKNDNISIGQKLRIPGASATSDRKVARAEVVRDAAPVSSSSKHKVQSGETFYSIARKHKVSVNTLIAANPNVRPTSLRVGQTLRIQPGAAPMSSSRSVAKSQPKPKAPATRKSERVQAPKPAKEVVRNAPADRTPVKKSAEPAIRTITVHQQMTYGQFASKYGASTTQLNALNGLSLNKSTMLAKGSELYVPQF